MDLILFTFWCIFIPLTIVSLGALTGKVIDKLIDKRK
jgi:hypothetical protein